MFNPAQTPAVNREAFRRVFLSKLFQRAPRDENGAVIPCVYRGKEYAYASSIPTAARKISLAGFTQEMPDMEIMIALDCGDAEPVSLAAEGVVFGGKEFRILNVQGDLGRDCYQLSLALRNR